MKQWWAKYKERAAERQKIANANIERSFEAFDRMMFEERERVEVKRLEKLAAKNEPMPPRFAIYLAYLFLPKRYREIVLGDMIEQYPALRARLGRFRASVRMYKQVFSSAWPLAKESIHGRGVVITLSKLVSDFDFNMFLLFLALILPMLLVLLTTL